MTGRFLLYSHDTYGLGHLRRNTTIATALVESDPDVEVLLVSGSPRSASFAPPPRTDVVQLPSVTKSASGSYEPRRLICDLHRIVELRSSIIEATLRSYRPDVFIVDHAPAGMAGELLPVISRMSEDPMRPRLVLGLREIIDDAATVAAQWSNGGQWDALETFDEVVVYGDSSVRSTAVELELDRAVGRPINHVGYCGPVHQPADLRTSEMPPLVVVTVGGGGDGYEVCSSYLDYLESKAAGSFRSVIVTGPLMAKRYQAQLEHRAEKLPGRVEVNSFVPNMRDLLNSAEAVVSMGGYNTVVELLAGGVPALIVPRTTPRREQALRCERLAERSHLECCPLEELSFARLDTFLNDAVGRSRHESSLDLNGAKRFAAALIEVVNGAGQSEVLHAGR